jgi:hypothetical protein
VAAETIRSGIRKHDSAASEKLLSSTNTLKQFLAYHYLSSYSFSSPSPYLSSSYCSPFQEQACSAFSPTFTGSTKILFFIVGDNVSIAILCRVAQAVYCLTTGWTIGVRSPAGAEDFSPTPYIQNRLWGPPSLLSNGYRGSFPGG